jgi:hypothetical protein
MKYFLKSFGMPRISRPGSPREIGTPPKQEYPPKNTRPNVSSFSSKNIDISKIKTISNLIHLISKSREAFPKLQSMGLFQDPLGYI